MGFLVEKIIGMKPEASFGAFEQASKLDIVYGQITSVSEVDKSDRLLNLTVDFGAEYGTKTILSAIKQDVADFQSLVGMSSFFVVNFAPRKMMGIESQGMIVPFNNANSPLLFGGPTLGQLSIGTKLF